jgi:hypothetical protein
MAICVDFLTVYNKQCLPQADSLQSSSASSSPHHKSSLKRPRAAKDSKASLAPRKDRCLSIPDQQYPVGTEVHVSFKNGVQKQGMVAGFTVAGAYHISFKDNVDLPAGDRRIHKNIMKNVKLTGSKDIVIPESESVSKRNLGQVSLRSVFQQGDILLWQYEPGVWVPVLVTNARYIKDKKTREEVLKAKPERLTNVPSVLVSQYSDPAQFTWVDQPFYDLICFGLYPELWEHKTTDNKAFKQAEREWTILMSREERARQMAKYAAVEGLEQRMRDILQSRCTWLRPVCSCIGLHHVSLVVHVCLDVLYVVCAEVYFP